MNLQELRKEIDLGYIDECKHESGLIILNYSRKAQFENRWNDLTIKCRGLIVDSQYNVVQRPFGKFFNIEQVETPAEPFEVYEKMDGSFGILYHLDKPHIATRGSFYSDQAIEATKILREKYSHIEFDKNLTYIFEIIYPENRIVVKYDYRDLVLTAIIDTKTGLDLPLQDIGFKLPRKYGFSNLEEIRSLPGASNEEGFVIKFAGGMRVKAKFAEYKRLHRIITGVNEHGIWESLRDGYFDRYIDRTPDEFDAWVRSVRERFLKQYREVEAIARSDVPSFDTRKENAKYINMCKFPAITFLMFDGKDYDRKIWNIIEPNKDKAAKCLYQ